MPIIPYVSPWASQLGFRFNYADAFSTECINQGVPSAAVTEQVSTNTANIAINTSNISTNTSNISTNTTNISTNTTDIVTNTSSITALTTSLGVSTDLYPSQNTAWGVAQQAYIMASNAGGGTTVPSGGGLWGVGLVWNGAAWVLNGDDNYKTFLGADSCKTNSGRDVTSMGYNSGNANQGEYACAFGSFAGSISQGINAVGVGWGAGNNYQGTNATAIGFAAGGGNQAVNAVAVGAFSGGSTQGVNSIAIGYQAGHLSQGDNCIAIGFNAGETNQPANTIVLNASGAPLNAAQAGGMYVNPIRNDNANPNWLTYNAMSGEITFDTQLPLSLGANIDAPALNSSVWAYAKQAEVNAQVGITWITNATTPNAPGELGTATDTVDSLWGGFNSLSSAFNSQYVPNVVGGVGTQNDTASLTTSLWAYAKQAEVDAQTSITWISTTTVRNAPNGIGTPTDTPSANLATASLWGFAKEAYVSGESAKGQIITLTTPNSNGQVGTDTDTPSLITSLWAYAKQAEVDALVAQTAANSAGAIVGTSGDTPSLLTTCFAYAKQAEIDAQTALIPNTSLQAAIRITPFSNIAPSALVWTSSSVATINVPLAASTANTCLAPIAPADNINGWRFSKTYIAIVPATSGLTTGATYTILVVGNINWTAIGASAATVGIQFTYSGHPITGNTTGTCQASTKMSWYQRNMLYGQSLPVLNLTYSKIQKSLLKNAWFLVKFNADVAQQGVLAIQIETYAFKYSGNTSNEYTGRWAYSFPNQQSSGFTATNTTNLSTSPTVPRLKAGFTYLLYASDDYPSTCPTTYTSARQYLPYGAGLFPSQVEVSNTLRNPYDIYPQYPHLALSGCMYSPNAIQPPYGGAGEYLDEADVEVSAIYLNSSSTAPNVGVGQTVLDFTVLNWGYTLGASPTITTVSNNLTWA